MTTESHSPQLRTRSRRTRDHKDTEERKHRRRRRSANKDGDGSHAYTRRGMARRSGSDADSSESDEATVKVVKSKSRKVRVVYVTEDGQRLRKPRERRAKTTEVQDVPKRSDESIRRSRASQRRRKSIVEAIVPRRSVSTKDIPSVVRPSLRRSKTTSSSVPQSRTTSTINAPAKRSSFMGSFFGGPVKPVEPEKLVECLTCMDDVPKSKAAKLKCGHRMCHSCLRRVFRLSITDPQHMPPKCCTSDHIPLEHVDKLFDIKFKRTWNRKFQEFSTKNRIYCPARKCGEWIKPSHIYKRDGRKYGECSRCKTKVCCLCNGKWHGSKECPKDEETNKLLDAAKEAGWQRCFSCRTMVELKEGCNHMTCRCTAEFCMICGLKWKTCNCPWFNYDAVEADRLEHMNVPVEVVEVQERPARRRRPPNNYQGEMEARRRQERADEVLARRMQRAAISSEDDDYQGGIGDIHGIGNGAGHFMNQDYVRAAQNILTGRFDQATAAANYVMGVQQARAPPRRRMAERYPVPPPPLRRQSTRDVPRAAERPAPERRHTESDVRPPEQPQTRPAVLAGLAGRGGNRVNAWRNHVVQGAPDEGVLSV